MYFVYVLQSQDNKLYVGLTNDIHRRLREHNDGKTRSTRARRPLKLIHSEEFLTRSSARDRERFLKSGRGRRLIRELLQRNTEAQLDTRH